MKIRVSLIFSVFALLSPPSFASIYNSPVKVRDNVIAEYPNEIAVTRADQNETLLDVARRFH